MLNLSLLIAILAMPFAFAGKDLVYSNIKNTYKAVVQLGNYGSSCTGTLVGLTPPTIITARHCSDNNVTQIGWLRPSKIITGPYENLEFNMYQVEVPGDLAVLIFEGSAENQFKQFFSETDLFTVSSDTVLVDRQEARICGFGYSSPTVPGSAGAGTQRCGTNNLIMPDPSINFSKDIEKYLEKNPDISFSQMPESMKVKYIHQNIQAQLNKYGKEDRFGFGALIFDPTKPKELGNFDKTGSKSLINQGDSGGPLFIAKEDGNVLIGVNSLVLASWNVFGSIFWSINSPWSQKLLKKAISEGADIRGLMKKARVIFSSRPLFLSRQGDQGNLKFELSNTSDVPTGPVKVTITTTSSNLLLKETDVTIPQIDSRSSVSQFISTYKIQDTAELGSAIFIKGKISYQDKEEEFTIQDTVRTNPSADVKVSYSANPKVNAFFDHSINVAITPKYGGVDKYLVEAIVINDQRVRFKEISEPAEAPMKGKSLKYKIPLALTYDHRGQTIRIKVSVSNGSDAIYEEIVELKPH